MMQAQVAELVLAYRLLAPLKPEKELSMADTVLKYKK